VTAAQDAKTAVLARLKPQLAERGFRKRGAVFWREVEDGILHLVDVSLGRRNSAGEGLLMPGAMLQTPDLRQSGLVVGPFRPNFFLTLARDGLYFDALDEAAQDACVAAALQLADSRFSGLGSRAEIIDGYRARGQTHLHFLLPDLLDFLEAAERMGEAEEVLVNALAETRDYIAWTCTGSQSPADYRRAVVTRFRQELDRLERRGYSEFVPLARSFFRRVDWPPSTAWPWVEEAVVAYPISGRYDV
jgi:hypothetical protein